ncbi:Uncharacterized protein APZ42_032989 [Daphnia magna]|uniref:HAT C-terminal dimerisation domain-containing protein n=1 Tax=Daphnia magna TaxID=35525 RepID=A0A164LIJ3_9CRUS|nr:Uncharacterized protein APZ42_032989 [Daphnia magna]
MGLCFQKIHTKDDLEKFNVLCCELDNDKPQTPIPEQLGKLSTQRKLSFSGYQKIITQKMLDDYILEYLCEAVLPVYHTERYDFRKFVSRLCPRLKIKSRGYYRKIISSTFEKKKSALKELLVAGTWVCTTADCWSSRRKSFLGMTIYWITADLKRASYCLAIRRVIGKRDYEILAKLLESIHEEFGITCKVVATILIAAKMTKTTLQHQVEYNCLKRKNIARISRNPKTNLTLSSLLLMFSVIRMMLRKSILFLLIGNVAETLDVLQSDLKLSIGYLLPPLTILKKKMIAMQQKRRIIHCKPFIANIISGIDWHFSHCFEDDDLILASLLHPKFKLNWVNEADKSSVTEKIENFYENFSQDSSSGKSVNRFDSLIMSELSEDSDFSCPTKRKKIFSHLTLQLQKKTFSEVAAFLGDSSTSISSLMKHPKLKLLFIKYNAPFTSSASVERLFSVGRSIFRPTRNRLSDTNFEKNFVFKSKQAFVDCVRIAFVKKLQVSYWKVDIITPRWH